MVRVENTCTVHVAMKQCVKRHMQSIAVLSFHIPNTLCMSLILGGHAQEGYGTCPVCLSVCYHLIVNIVHFYGPPKVRAALF